MIRGIFFVLLFFGCFIPAVGQYVVNGYAHKDDCHCFTLTSESPGYQYGAVWNNQKIDLTQSFNLTFNVYLGSIDINGADGIAFVLQNDSRNTAAIGGIGNGLGFAGITPSVGVFLDTYQNPGEVSFDFTSIELNGNIAHSVPSELVAPVPASATSDNIEDGIWHTLTINWNAPLKRYSVYFDNVLRASTIYDFVNNVFGGNSMVYWGFTGATGGAVNFQRFCTRSDNLSIYFAPGQKTCIGSPITFYDSSITFGTPLKRYWNFGDGTIDSTSINPTHIYNTAGVYNVILKIVNQDSCTEADTLQVTIHSKPVANFHVSNACRDSVVILTDSSYNTDGAVNNWYWNFGNGNTSTVQNPAPTYPVSGVQTIFLAVQSSFGCASDTVSRSVVIYPRPLANFNFVNNVCQLTTVQFNDLSTMSPGLITGWEWNFGNMQTSTLQNPSMAYGAGGVYNVTLTAQSDKGCKSAAITKSITILPKPVAYFKVINLCQFAQGVFLDSSYSINGAPITQWNWDFGNGQTSLLQNPVGISYNAPGAYTIKLVVSTTCVSDTFFKVINIAGKPVANFIKSNACQDSTISLQDSSYATNNSIINWHWDFGTGTSVQQNPTVSYATAGSHTIKLAVQALGGCVSDTISKTVEIYPKAVGNFSFTNNQCQSSTVLFNDLSAVPTGSITGWQWDLGNSQTSILQNPSATYNTAGVYNVSLVAQTDKGCKSIPVNKSITILPKPVAYFKVNTICQLAAATFTDSSYSPNGLPVTQWNWNFGNGQTSTSQNPAGIIYNTNGTYTVKLVVKTTCTSDTFSRTITVNAKPVANFSYNDSCVQNSIHFTDMSVATGSTVNSFYWDFDNGMTSGLPDPNTSYLTGGIKNVKLYVKSQQGCASDTLTKPVFIYTRPVLNFTFNDSVCLGSPTNFTGQVISSNAPVNGWVWNFGDTNGVINTQNAQHYFTTPGHHTVLFGATSTGNAGCLGLIQKDVFVIDKPVAYFKANNICESVQTLLQDSSYTNDGLSITQWWWDLGNGQQSILQNPPAIYNGGNILVKLAVKSSGGCMSDTLSKSLVVNPKPISNFGYGSPLCFNIPAMFTDSSAITSGSISNYYWYFDNGTSTLKNPSQLFPSGNHVVKLLVQSAAGCFSDTAQKSFTVDSKPLIGMDFSDGCKNDNINFTAIDSMTNMVSQWQWRFGDGIPGTGSNPQHIYRSSGAFTVSLYGISNGGCMSDTLKKIIKIYSSNANAGPDIIAAQMQPVQLNATGGQLYEWTPSTGLNNTLIANPVATLIATQAYVVKAYSVQGCASYDTVVVKIYKGPDIYVPTAFSPNNDGLNDVLKAIPIGITQFNFLKVYNRWGEEVFSTTDPNKGWTGYYKGSDAPGGVYVWMASGVDFKGNLITRKGIVMLVR